MASSGFQSRFFFLAASISCVLTLGSNATHAQWTYRAAPDPIVRSLSVFPNTPAAGTTTLIAATLGGGMFKGVDNGSSWTWHGINNGLPTGTIWNAATININTIYAGTDTAGLYKTADGGSTWLPSNGSGATALGCMSVRNISSIGSTLYVATRCRYNSGLYTSIDNGLTWTHIGTSVIPTDAEGQFVRIDDTGTLVLFATRNYGIFKSTDSGSTWVQANTGIAGSDIAVLNIQCGTSCATLLAYVEGQGVYRSNNTGTTWFLSNTGLPVGFAALSGISRDGTTTPPTFYVSLDKQGVYRTTDSGATWSLWGNTATTSDVAFPRSLSRDSSAPGKYYLGTLDGVYKTLDDGLNWTNVQMRNGRVNWITHDSSNLSVAYLSAASLIKVSNIYAGNYDSVTAPIDVGITGTTINGATAQDPTNANVLYATTDNRGIFKSINGGALWSAINTGLPSLVGQPGRIFIDPNDSRILYLGIINGAGIYRSTDGGANWTAANDGLTSRDSKSVGRIEIDRNVSSTLYASTDAGLYKSTDSAGSWALVYSALDGGGNPLGISGVRLNPFNTQEIYLANSHTDPNGALLSSAGIQKSTDGGLTWTNVLPGRRAQEVRVLRGGVVFAGLSEGVGQPAVLRSTDGGSSWQVYSSGLLGSDIRGFSNDPNDDLMISLALENGFYTFAVSAHTDCFFNWAEFNFPSLFSPAGASSTLTPYYYRYFPQTQAYLAASFANNHFYYLGPWSNYSILDAGALSPWLSIAGCH